MLIGGLPAARVGDMAVCVGPPDAIVKGSATVLIGGVPAARMGDATGAWRHHRARYAHRDDRRLAAMAGRDAHFLGTGWSFPPAFSANRPRRGDGQRREDIRESLWILLSTSPGERVMVPEYGCALWRMVFEKLDVTALTEIQDLVSAGHPQLGTAHHRGRGHRRGGSGVLPVWSTSTSPTRSAGRTRRSNLVYPFYVNEATIAPPRPDAPMDPARRRPARAHGAPARPDRWPARSIPTTPGPTTGRCRRCSTSRPIRQPDQLLRSRQRVDGDWVEFFSRDPVITDGVDRGHRCRGAERRRARL